jgi:hypothetical protein
MFKTLSITLLTVATTASDACVADPGTLNYWCIEPTAHCSVGFPITTKVCADTTMTCCEHYCMEGEHCNEEQVEAELFETLEQFFEEVVEIVAENSLDIFDFHKADGDCGSQMIMCYDSAEHCLGTPKDGCVLTDSRGTRSNGVCCDYTYLALEEELLQ